MRATQLLGALGTPQHGRVVLVLPGNPLPKARTRSKPGQRPYYPKVTVAAEKAATTYLLGLPQYQGNVALVCIFYRSSNLVVDTDNLEKLLMDAATKAGVWRDDSQVTAKATVVELDREAPRTVVAFGHHHSTLVRT